MKLYLSLFVSLIAFTPACKKKTDTTTAGSAATTTTPTPPPTTTPPPPPPTGSAAMGSADMGSAMAGSAMAGSAAAPAAPSLTDPQIAAIVVAANQVDIDAGKLALKKTKNAEVKKFAQQMVTDHTAINKAAGDLVKKLKVTPEENDTSKALVSGGKDNMAKLEKLSGAEFDKAYVDNEVTYHQAVIDAIDQQLIPSASNAELKNTLVSVKPTIDEHLQHAKHVQEMLAGGGSGAGGSAAHGH